MKISGKESSFQTKLDQAAGMLIQLAHHFTGVPVTVVCDSWFGNNGLFKPLRQQLGDTFHLLSRLRSNIVLYSMPPNGKSKKRDNPAPDGEECCMSAATPCTQYPDSLEASVGRRAQSAAVMCSCFYVFYLVSSI